MKTILKRGLLCLLCWAGVLAVCFGLMCAAASIPADKLSDGLRSSSEKLAARDPHEAAAGSFCNSICDNYADAILLGIAANMTSDNIAEAVIDTRYYDDGYGAAVGILATLKGYESNVDYTRYWHGSLILIRPLLAVTDISGIRLIGSLLISVLLALDLFLLIRKRHIAAAVILAVSAVLVHFWFVFTTLEYMPMFVIMLAAIPLYMKFAQNDTALLLLSAGVGTLTAFTDFLTTETITLLVPLVIVFFVRASDGKKADVRKSFILLISCGAAWLGAYALTFLSKWVIASAVTGNDISTIALEAAGERFWGMPEDISSPIVMLFSSLGANLTMLAPSSDRISVGWIIGWAVCFAVVCLIIAKADKKRHNLPKAVMIVIAALPLLRFAVLMDHSYLHCYFTYRAMMPAIMAMLGLAWYRVGARTKRE